MTRQCVEKATVADVADPGTLLNSFFWMKVLMIMILTIILIVSITMIMLIMFLKKI